MIEKKEKSMAGFLKNINNMKHLKLFEEFSQISEQNWIQDDIKRPGSLRKSLKKKRGQKITNSDIGKEMSKLRKKDKDSDKPGIQGLNKSDLRKLKQLNLAKTLKGFKD